ncbi:hypothetical protein UPYG_G00161600 [Umbra pygmaea]|uniref:Coiled-coil-helix-coiled-coil-helix domain containing 6b n=1 Tax=Umbra pygmaea TaxID=75934 RepID=A0ABD0WRU5_UMBPY
MGGSESTRRKVSFGLDEEEKVTVIQGVKLSGELLRRMREGTDSAGVPPTQPGPHRHEPGAGPGQTPAEAQNELRRKFEVERAHVQEQLARLAQRDAASGGRREAKDLDPAELLERGKSHEDMMNARQLAKQLKSKETELQHLATFYKEQLQILEKKNLDHYQQTTEQYQEAATKAEAHFQPRPTVSVCPELQAQVLLCYKDNQQQTLCCSRLAKQYMDCIQAAKKKLLINHG